MRQLKVTTILIALLVVIGGVIVLWSNEPLTVSRHTGLGTASGSIKPTSGSGRKNIALFFVAGDGNSFHEETRQIRSEATTTTEDAKRTLTELVRGPENGDLMPTVSREVQLLNLFIDSSGIAYVDFNRSLQDGLPGGAQGEVYAVFSIINTLTSNFAQITCVQILIEGGEIPTLAGHVDTRIPLLPRYVF